MTIKEEIQIEEYKRTFAEAYKQGFIDAMSVYDTEPQKDLLVTEYPQDGEKRGDCIAETGQSGRASGPHLHYEVHYKGEKVNPANYFDLSMSKDEYLAMVGKREAESQAVLTRRPFSVSRR